MDSNEASTSFTNFFVAAQLTGAVLLIILVGTVLLSRQVERNVTWTNLCIALIVSAFSYTILEFAGYQRGPQPPTGVCFAQSVLVYGAGVLVAISSLTLSIQLHLDLKSNVLGIKASNPRRNTTLFLSPYIGYVLVIAGTIVYGRDRGVSRTSIDTYCHFTTSSFGDRVVIFSTLNVVFNLCLLGYVVVRLARHSKSAKNIEAIRPLRRGILRILSLQLVLFFPIIASIIFLRNKRYRYLFDFMLACLPLLTFGILGIQPDVLRVWFWWYRPTPHSMDDPQPLEVESPVLSSKDLPQTTESD